MKLFKVKFFSYTGNEGIEEEISFDMLGESVEELAGRINKIYNDEYLNGFEIDGQEFRDRFIPSKR